VNDGDVVISIINGKVLVIMKLFRSMGRVLGVSMVLTGILHQSAFGQSAPVPDGLVGWWRFENNILDEKTQKTGSLVGNAAYATGECGQGIFFDGRNSGVLIPDSSTYHVQAFTLEGWIKRGDTSIVSHDQYGFAFLFGYGMGGYGVGISDSGDLILSLMGADHVTVTTSIRDTNYHHVAVSKNGNTTKFYVDGVKYDGPDYYATFSFTSSLAVGMINGTTMESFLGTIDEFSLYNRPLEDVEVLSIYQAGSHGKAYNNGAPFIARQPQDQTGILGGTAQFSTAIIGDGISYQWTFNGTNILSATNNTLSLTNLTQEQAGTYAVYVSNSVGSIWSSNAVLTIVETLPCVPAPAGIVGLWKGEAGTFNSLVPDSATAIGDLSYGPGYIGQGFVLDGTTAGVNVGSPVALQNQNLTIEAWIQRANPVLASHHSYGVGIIFAYSSGGYGLALENSGNLAFSRIGTSYVDVETGIKDTNFHHVAVTKSGVKIKFYVDGKEYVASDYDVPFTFTGPAAVGIIPDMGIEGFLGTIDEVAVYNRALTADEVGTQFRAGKGGKCTDFPPTIGQQPVSQSVYVKDTVTFTPNLAGACPMTVQWFFNGNAIAGATNTQYSVFVSDNSVAGDYYFVASNIFASVTSSNATITVLQTTSATPPTSLIAWWRGEGNAWDQVGGHQGTALASTTYAPAYVGQGFVFDGHPGSGVDISDSADLHVQNFSIEFWIKRGSTTLSTYGFGNAPLFGYGNGGYSVAMNKVGNILVGKTGDFFTLGPSIQDTQFHHVVVTKDGSNVNFYIDGNFIFNRYIFTTFTFSSNLAIGKASESDTANFLGTLDEVSFYNAPLTSSDVSALYGARSAGKVHFDGAPGISVQPQDQSSILGGAAQFSVSAIGPGPNFQWAFNGTNLPGATNNTLLLTNLTQDQAGTYAVYVSNSFGGIWSTNAILTILETPPCVTAPIGIVGLWKGESSTVNSLAPDTTSAIGSLSYGPGYIGQGFVCDGSSAGADVGNPVSLQNQDLTIEAWIQRGDTALATYHKYGAGIIFSYSTGGYGLALENSGDLAFSWIGASYVDVKTGITDTNFHHVAVTKSGVKIKFYVDGKEYIAEDYNVSFTFTGPAAIGIIPDMGIESFLGTIDEVAVYNRPLTADEIGTQFRAGKAGKCTDFPPIIDNQPVSQNAYVNDIVIFTPTITGASPMTLQWFFNGNSIANATNLQYSVRVTDNSVAGNYYLVASNIFGSVVSSNATLTVQQATSVTAPSSLIAWWRGEDNAWDQVGGHQGTALASTTYAPSYVGQGFVFDGHPGSGISLTDSADLHVQNFSIEFWIQRGSTTRSTYDSGNTAYLFGYGSGGYSVSMNAYGNLFLAKTGNFSLAGPAIRDTKFHHVVVTKNGNDIYYYIDGNLAGMAYHNPSNLPSNPADSAFIFITNPAIGKAGGMDIANFLGTMDEVSFYNVPLTSSDVSVLYNAHSAGKVIVTDSPTILTQPANVVAHLGDRATFTVQVAGTMPMQFQWYHNGTAITDATNSTLIFVSTQLNDEGTYYVTAINSVGSVTSTSAALSLMAPPSITTQSVNQTVVAGGTLTLTSAVSGSQPMTLRWYFEGNPIAEATNATLVLQNIQPANQGHYQLLAQNAYGQASSTTILVTVASCMVQALDASVTSGDLVTVPLQLVTLGTENAVGFSLNFNPDFLTFVSIDLNSAGTGITFISNTNGAAAGKVGVAFAKESGTQFGAGTQTIATVTFKAKVFAMATNAVIAFGDDPTLRKVVDSQTQSVAVQFLPGTVSISDAQFEGDASPFPDGDHKLQVDDWVEVGRIVAGLDTVTNALQFQKVDCAPRDTMGNGILSITDWVQAGRYAIGLDPLTIAGGPTVPSLRAATPKVQTDNSDRTLSVTRDSNAGTTPTLGVTLNSAGNETAAGFSVNYDPTLFQFTRATLGNGASGAVLNVNSKLASSGHLGIAISMPVNSTFSMGSRELVKLEFKPLFYSTNTASFGFGDSPIAREISDSTAKVLAVSCLSTNFNISGNGQPSLTIRKTGDNLLVSWPAGATGFVLQSADTINGTWADSTVSPVTDEAENTVTIPQSSSSKFYRLKRP
jgi:hypothetical protein